MSNASQTALDAARSLYSDLHKEVRGFRPRDFAHLSLVEIDRRIQGLDCEILDRREDEARASHVCEGGSVEIAGVLRLTHVWNEGGYWYGLNPQEDGRTIEFSLSEVTATFH